MSKAGSRSRRGLKRCCLAVLLLASHCGYRIASHNRLAPALDSIAVVLENESQTFQVEQILSRTLIRTLVQQTDYRVVSNPSRADGVLKGTIIRVTANPVTFGRGSFGSTFVVILTAKLELRDRRQEKVLFRNDRFVFREQYVINSDVENFFSELNPALERIAVDFASSVVSSIREGF